MKTRAPVREGLELEIRGKKRSKAPRKRESVNGAAGNLNNPAPTKNEETADKWENENPERITERALKHRTGF